MAYRAPSDEIKEWLQPVVGVIEATNDEKSFLWERFASDWYQHNPNWPSYTWGSGNSGFLSQVGLDHGRVVMISLLIDIIAGQKILFWHPTSLIVNHKMIERWLRAAIPNVAWCNKGDAGDLTNVIRGVV